MTGSPGLSTEVGKRSVRIVGMCTDFNKTPNFPMVNAHCGYGFYQGKIGTQNGNIVVPSTEAVGLVITGSAVSNDAYDDACAYCPGSGKLLLESGGPLGMSTAVAGPTSLLTLLVVCKLTERTFP